MLRPANKIAVYRVVRVSDQNKGLSIKNYYTAL